MTTPEAEAAPALKEIFNVARLRHIATEVAGVYPAFDQKKFLRLVQADLDSLSLMQRLRRTSESLHATLPADYEKAVAILRKLAPRINSGFVTPVCCPTMWASTVMKTSTHRWTR